MTEEELAILASFVYCPPGRQCQGRQGRHIAKVCSGTFYSLFKYRTGLGSNSRFPWWTNITRVCRKLERRGYLFCSGYRSYTGPDGSVAYRSPLFFL